LRRVVEGSLDVGRRRDREKVKKHESMAHCIQMATHVASFMLRKGNVADVKMS